MIGTLKTELQELLGNTGLSWVSFLLQLFIIVFFLWFCYKSFVKNSPAEKTVKGMLFFLVFTWLISEFFMLFHLRILAGLLRNFILLLILSAVIIFQPELRRLMSLLGNQVTFFTKAKRKQLSDSLVNILIQSIAYWRKYRTGALIAFERMEPVNTVCTGGISLDAKISTELLINLFFVNTPLHDGAVVCSQNRIAKAGVILPLSKDATLSWKYGTRHRAAIGLSETTDALCLVVSEETGDVSLIQDGKVQTFYEMNELEKALPEFLSSLIQKNPPKTFWQKLKSLSDK
ncbi:MAG: TIGR00159 family protein [Alphaproteobacteria bacterium]|nr:TIGR00159 family protein [Alphaproteobacteria bacterium]